MKFLFLAFLSALIFVGILNVHVSTLVLNQSLSPEKEALLQVSTLSTNATTTITAATTNTVKHNKNHPPRRALIIATVPRSIKHVFGLWSELECFSLDVDAVILTGPTWSRPILEPIVALARDKIPRFSTTNSTLPISLSTVYFVNNLYDVGLWCDALQFLDNNDRRSFALSSFDEVALLNDSVFALREYRGILQALSEKDVRMTSLSYSLYGPSLKGYGKEYKWLESVWRGFDREGLQTFRDYSCRPANDKLFCPKKKGWKRKKCIIDNFERAMGQQFPPDKTWGLFSSDVPTRILTGKNWFRTWVQNEVYWQELVKDGFPLSKVSYDKMIDSIDDDRLKTCTSKMDRQAVDKIDFSIVPKK